MFFKGFPYLAKLIFPQLRKGVQPLTINKSRTSRVKSCDSSNSLGIFMFGCKCSSCGSLKHSDSMYIHYFYVFYKPDSLYHNMGSQTMSNQMESIPLHSKSEKMYLEEGSITIIHYLYLLLSSAKQSPKNDPTSMEFLAPAS